MHEQFAAPSPYPPTPLPDFPLFFSILPRPPRSTLFPYTTLFRSSGRHPRRKPRRWRAALAPPPAPSPPPHPPVDRKAFPVRDRKSTRLNSSHRCISYAVFCLKKKNSKTIMIRLLWEVSERPESIS